MKIYFAQTMDNLAYYEHAKRILDILEYEGHEVYFPWRDEGVIFEDQSTKQDQFKTFMNDVNHINWCDCMIAYIDGDDPGTAVEAGIAYQLDKPIALYATEFQKLRKGVDISELYPVDVLPANSHQYWITRSDPVINNMLLGVSNNTVLNTVDDILRWISEVESKLEEV